MNDKLQIKKIDDRLGKIEKKLELLEAATKRSWLGNVLSWCQIHKKITTFVASTLITIGTTFYFGYYLPYRERAESRQFATRLNEELNKSGGLISQLAEVKAASDEANTTLKVIQPFIQDLVQKEMSRASALPFAQFQDNLPAIANALNTARIERFSIPSKSVNGVSIKLAQLESQTSPEYWKAASALINYRIPAKQALPDCSSKTPDLTLSTPNTKQMPLAYGEGLQYKNCTIVLDDAEAITNSNLWKVEHRSMQQDPRSNRHFTLTLTHVHVIYRGGKILPADEIVFESCTFEFEVNAAPPSRALDLTKRLLATEIPPRLVLGTITAKAS